MKYFLRCRANGQIKKREEKRKKRKRKRKGVKRQEPSALFAFYLRNLIDNQAWRREKEEKTGDGDDDDEEREREREK